MKKIQSDILIIGGGVAGLWLHNRLNDLGYKTLLIEKSLLGGAQTLSSQGIIHGGAKYTLGGVFSNAASAISDMPRRWSECLEGVGDIDLSNTMPLSQNQLMWSSQGLPSKLTSFFSSKVLRGKVARLSPADFPLFFKEGSFDGDLYQLNEPVVDVQSLLCCLAEKWRSRILCKVRDLKLVKNEVGELTAAVLENAGVQITASQFIFAAGEGNEAILNSLSMSSPLMQRRPLKMVLLKGRGLADLYAHCIGASSKPIATITTHRHSDGDNVWYIGGGIAEKGVELSDSELIAYTQLTLNKVLPWIDLAGLNWSVHSVNRAESVQSSLLRPDTSFVETTKNVHICWPTKLALTPNLSDQIVESLSKALMPSIESKTSNELFDEELLLLAHRFNPMISESLWERKFS